MKRSDEKLGLGLILILAAFSLVTLASPLLHGKVYLNDDLGQFHFPLRNFYSQALAAGDGFLWSPHLFCGFYLHGDGQLGMYHPWHLLLYSTLPTPIAFNVEILANYPWAFAGTYLLLRRRRLGRDTAAIGALMFAFAGFNLFHYMHVNAVSVVAQLSWLLLCLDVAMCDESRRRAAWGRLGVGLLTASQLLLGYPQYVFYSLLAEGLYVLFLAWQPPGVGWRRPAGWALAKAFGLLGGAAQLLPTWDLLANSNRIALAGFGSLHPLNLIQMVAPYAYKARVVAPSFWLDGFPAPVEGPAENLFNWRVHEFGLHNGAVVPVLALWLWLRRRDLGMLGPLAGAAVALGVLALGLAMGDYNPLFRLYTSIPLAATFRLPARHLVLYHLATAVLVAIALADLSRFARSGRSLPWRRLWLLSVPLALAILFSLGPDWLGSIWPPVLREPPRSSSRTMLEGLAIAAFAGLMTTLAARGHRLAPLGLLTLAGVDQSYYLTSYLRYTQVVLESPPLNVPIEESRVAVVRKELSPNLLTLSGHRLTGGYVGLGPRRKLDYGLEPTWRVAAAGRAYDACQPAQPWKPIPDPLPRARLVTGAVTEAALNGGSPAGFATADLSRIDLRKTAIVGEPAGLRLDEGGRPGSATIVGDRPGSIDVETDAESRQLLVLAESYYPGWRARVDGRSAEVLRVNHDFQGCVVEAGRHRISWRFEPESTRLGVRLSILGFALMVGSLGWSYLASRGPVARRLPDETRPRAPA